MGLLLRPDAYYAASADRVYLLSHEGPLILRGHSVVRLLDRLAPYLTGEHTWTELTADLTADRRESVSRLLDALVRHGVVRATGQREPERPALSATLRSAYDPEIRFVGYHQKSPTTRFQAFREKGVLVIGAGELLNAVAVSFVRAGSCRVRVVTTAECPTNMDRLLTDTARARRDHHQDVSHRRMVDETEHTIRDELAWADLVVHVSDVVMPERFALVDRACTELGVVHTQAFLTGSLAFLGPLWEPRRSDGAASWQSAWRRLAAWHGHPTVSPDAQCRMGLRSDLAVAAAASRIVHGLFLAATGIGTDSATNQLVRMDLATLEHDVHRFLPHPLDVPTEPDPDQDVTAWVDALEAGPRLDRDSFSRKAVTCTGDTTGVFTAPSEGEFAQIPLQTCEIRVSSPFAAARRNGDRLTVFGIGDTFEEARIDAAVKAFAYYCAMVVDPRRLRTRDGGPFHSGGDTESALQALARRPEQAFLFGHDAKRNDTVLVRADSVFPVLRDARHPILPGTAAALSWTEAVEAAMLQHAKRITLADAANATSPFPRIDVAASPMDDRGGRYREKAAALGEDVTAFDITAGIGVPTVLCYLGPTAAGCASGLTIQHALRDSLKELLVHYQARASGYPPGLAERIPALPPGHRGLATSVPTPATDLHAIVASLRHRGLGPVVVPLDHDPAVQAIMPYAVRVVLRHV